MDMRSGMWNIRNVYMASYLMTVSKEVSKYKLNLVKYRSDGTGVGTEKAGEYTCFYRKGKENSIISAVKRVEFVSDRMSYIILRGRWCHIIVLNVHTSTGDINDDVKDSFYKELESVFDKL
jgi:hypothetical protein